ncbi:MAG: hypothetical protein LUQ01_03300, partial [Methanolinea sp.]|nr:hypothetical protein [Methanolinea sp.]
GFVRVHPKSISMEEPPLLLRLQSAYVEQDGRSYTFTVVARVFDIGAISLCLILDEPQSPSSMLEEAALRFAGQRGLDAHFGAALTQLRAILTKELGDRPIDPGFYDDYTIYLADRLDTSTDPVAVLLGEKIPFSRETRTDTLQHTLSYGADDRAIISWDGTILISPDPPIDLIELVEFAMVQVLELRFYDRELSRQMEKMYVDIEVADRLWWYRRVQQYHSLMKGLMSTQAEVSEITEKISNLIKVTEDVYYARVYATTLRALRIQQWTDSVNHRISVIRENYRMLSDEVNVQHSHFLEWVVIALIAFEILIFILPIPGH